MIIFNFRKFNIKITSDSVIVNYGKANKRIILFEKIDDCYLDKTSAIWYGGWGLRMGRVKGKWRDVYNVIGYPRVALSLKDAGFFKEFVFSTKNPEEVMKIINDRILTIVNFFYLSSVRCGQLKKTGGKKMDLELLRNTASAFKKSAERSLEQKPLPNGQIESFIVPAVVNLAFSIELYLKFLLAKNETPSRGHKLLDLFNSLDPSIRQDIIKLTNYNKDKFEELLKKHSEAFVEWRYIHEKDKSKDVILEFMRELICGVESIVTNHKVKLSKK